MFLAEAKREDWDAHDPTLISEGLFAAANIFSTLKLIYIFTTNPHLGPLQISLGRMVIDILKFLFIALLVCFSYSCGVNQLYWYYAEARSRECEVCLANNETRAECKTQCDRALAKCVFVNVYLTQCFRYTDWQQSSLTTDVFDLSADFTSYGSAY